MMCANASGSGGLNTLVVTVDGADKNYVLIANSNCNGKNFWVYPSHADGVMYKSWSTIYWTGSEWIIGGQYGPASYDYASNSSDEARPPSGGWTGIGPYSVVSVAYAVIDLPTWTVAGYACATGNSGWNNPTFNGLYYRLNGSTTYFKVVAPSQFISNSEGAGIYTFHQGTVGFYLSGSGAVDSYYNRLTTNDQPPGQFDPNNVNDGTPAPTVTLGAC